MRTRSSICFLLLIAFLASCGNQEKVSLRFKPEVGVTKNVHMSVNVEMAGMMGAGSGVKMEMDAKMTPQNIRDNGDVELEVKYDRIMMSMNMMGQNLSFDSSKDILDVNDPKSAAFIPLNAILNQSLSFVMNDKAKIVESPDLNSFIPDSLKAKLGEQANNSDAERMMENMFAIFPEEEVYVGYSWDAATKISTAQGPIDMNVKYTVKEITADLVTLDLTGTLNGEVPSMGMTVKMTGTNAGTLIIDRATGNTVSSQIVQDIDTKVMGMSMGVKNTINVECK